MTSFIEPVACKSAIGPTFITLARDESFGGKTGKKKGYLKFLDVNLRRVLTWIKSNLSVFALESSILGYSTLDKACENGFHKSYGILDCLSFYR